FLPELAGGLDDLDVILGLVEAKLHPLHRLRAMFDLRILARMRQKFPYRIVVARDLAPLHDEHVRARRGLAADHRALRHAERDGVPELPHIVFVAVAERLPTGQRARKPAFLDYLSRRAVLAQLIDDAEAVIDAAETVRGIDQHEAALAHRNAVGM